MRSLLGGLCLVCLIPGVGLAADLMNFDSKAYTFKFLDGSTSSKGRIGPRGRLYGLCNPSSQCKITLNGQTMSLTNSSKIKIENGKLLPL